MVYNNKSKIFAFILQDQQDDHEIALRMATDPNFSPPYYALTSSTNDDVWYLAVCLLFICLTKNKNKKLFPSNYLAIIIGCKYT